VSTTTTPPPPAGSPKKPPPIPRSGLRWLWRGLVAVAVLAALVIAPIAWIVRTQDGTAWLLAQIPQLKISGARGMLFGDFAADRLEIALPGGAGQDRVVLTKLQWRGLVLERPPLSLGRIVLRLDSLQAERVDVQTTPDPKAPPAKPPASLRLPLEFEVRSLHVGELHATPLGDKVLRRLQAHLHVGADGGATHRVDALSLAFDRLQAAGKLQIGSSAPFNIAAQIEVSPDPSQPVPADAGLAARFDAKLRADGPLERLQVQATLRGAAPAGRPESDAPALDAKATVLPFAAWPLGDLEASTRALDLSALASAAPATAISGTARAATAGLNAPASVTLELENARVGRVDETLLPLRSLRAEVRGRPDDPTRFELNSIEAVLGTVKDAAGTLSGSGSWAPQGASLALKLADIRPRLLDRRAPDMRIGGTADLHGEGLVAPAGGAAATPRFGIRSTLAGSLQWAGRAQKLQLELDAAGDAQRIELRKADARAGASRATLAGQATHGGTGAGAGWLVDAKGALSDFDPAAWWPGAEGSAWRQGPHRINAALTTKLQVPDNIAERKTALAQVSALRGDASLTLTDSVLAGAPIAGELSLHSENTQLTSARATLNVADAALQASGQLDGSASGARDHWEVNARQVDLVKLAPLLRLAQAAGAPGLALAGQIEAQASLDGRWPRVTSSGTASLKQLAVAQTRLDSGSLRWTLGTAQDAPLDVQAELKALVISGGATPQTLDSARLTLQGSFAKHNLSLSAASPVRPPAWIDLLQAPPHDRIGQLAPNSSLQPADGTLADLRAQGALQFDLAGRQPLRWQGSLQRLELHGRNSRAPAWLSVSETPIDVGFDPATQVPSGNVGAGRAQLPGAALRWSQVRWQGGPAPLVDLQAELEPIAVAPLLAKIQPDFGWGGDLVVAGKVNLRSAPSVFVQIEIARQSGDLNVTDETGAGKLALGLSDLRMALDAKDGVWQTTLAFAGKTLGSMAGAITLRTDPKALVPPPETPMQGVLEAQIANLGAWGAWVPAGWRLAGRLHASANISGSFGAPEYTGSIDGQGLGVRNFLEGVDVHDGELAISLKGETARIDKFSARAGDGTVDVSGSAGFGATPQAQIKLVANRLQVLGRVDRRILASGQAELGLNADAIKLDGQFKIDEGLIDFSQSDAPSLSEDVEVVRDKNPKPVDAATSGKAPRAVALNVGLDLGEQLRLKGRGLDTRLRGQLKISAPGGKLAVNGNVRTAEGTYAAYRQKLDIERGLIAFSGPTDNPRLDILAVRPNLDVRVGVAITGSALNPRVRLFSDPDMSDTDKLSWLVLGKAPDTLGRTDTALLQSAALALLAGEGSSPTDDITKRLGLDTLSLSQSDGEVRETILSLGKQISDRWYVGYERSLTATAGNWQLIYRIARQFTLRAQAGSDNSIDAIWTWRWH